MVSWPTIAPVPQHSVSVSKPPIGLRKVLVWVALTVLVFTAQACSGSTSSEPAGVAAGIDASATVEPVATTAPFLAPTPLPAPTPLALPTPAPTPEFGPTGRPSSAGEVYVLTASDEVRRPVVYDSPDGTEVPVTYEFLDGRVDPTYDYFTNPTYFGNSLAMMVVDGEPGDEWAEVMIPTRPIMTAWVNTSQYSWSSSDYYVRVDISTNTVKVWRGDEVIVDDVSVVTGNEGRETPVASTFVDEIMRGPSSAYGPWLLSLGVFSDAINTFGSAGGLPKVALHGTNQPSLLGQYASNGCIRLPNDVITMLANEVPVGTRVDLVRSS